MTVVILLACSGLYYFTRRVLRVLDAPDSEQRTLTGLVRALDASPLVSVAFGLAPLPFVVVILKLLAGVDNLLLITYGSNFSSASRAQFPGLSTGQFFVAELLVLGFAGYALIYAWLLSRWRSTGELM